MDWKSFEEFRKLVYEQSGIALGTNKEALVSARIGKRMRALGMADLSSYMAYVRSDETNTEIVKLIDAISTNVTHFFREPEHFNFLQQVLSTWVMEGRRRFRFWSAASSTGEEPYSMAITLREALQGVEADVRILATDISTDVLACCEQGEYSKDKIAKVPGLLRGKYFQSAGNNTYRVRADIKRDILFKRLNLSRPPFPMQGPLDMVFCRNVMIYFDTGLRERLLREIHRLLRPGGYLIVGHSESLTGIHTDLKSVRPSIYIK